MNKLSFLKKNKKYINLDKKQQFKIKMENLVNNMLIIGNPGNGINNLLYNLLKNFFVNEYSVLMFNVMNRFNFKDIQNIIIENKYLKDFREEKHPENIINNEVAFLNTLNGKCNFYISLNDISKQTLYNIINLIYYKRYNKYLKNKYFYNLMFKNSFNNKEILNLKFDNEIDAILNEIKNLPYFISDITMKKDLLHFIKNKKDIILYVKEQFEVNLLHELISNYYFNNYILITVDNNQPIFENKYEANKFVKYINIKQEIPEYLSLRDYKYTIVCNNIEDEITRNIFFNYGIFREFIAKDLSIKECLIGIRNSNEIQKYKINLPYYQFVDFFEKINNNKTGNSGGDNINKSN